MAVLPSSNGVTVLIFTLSNAYEDKRVSSVPFSLGHICSRVDGAEEDALKEIKQERERERERERDSGVDGHVSKQFL